MSALKRKKKSLIGWTDKHWFMNFYERNNGTSSAVHSPITKRTSRYSSKEIKVKLTIEELPSRSKE